MKTEENQPVHYLTKLLSPIRIGSMEVKNRFAMAPMATNWAEADGSISSRMRDYFEARAKGGVGLIIMEVSVIDARFPYLPRTFGLWSDDLIPGMRRFTDSMHQYGVRVIPQISHPGPDSISPMLTNTQTIGPSVVINQSTKQMSREMSVAEIAHVVEQFGQAARRAREGGFDGLEVHAAHAYMLVGSFLSALRNRRTDDYGGSLENRMRFPLEVIESIRKHAGADFPIVLRLSGDELMPGGRDIRGTQYIAPIFEQAGVNAFHISGGVYPAMSRQIIGPYGTPLGSNVGFAAAVKQVVKVPVFAVGRINDPRFAENILQRGEADVIVMGRSLLADPEMPNKAASGRFDDIAPCTGCCQGCLVLMKNKEMSCVINPTVGREREMSIVPATAAKKVMVVGGGPAGLEAARVAALRGHRVALYEKTDKFGGQLNLAAVPPTKQELSKWVVYLARQVSQLGVDMRLNTEVTVEMVQRLHPDVLIVATGSRPVVPAIPGVDKPHVTTAHDVLAGRCMEHARNVVVWGGGMVGLETADFLAEAGANQPHGKSITIVTGKEEVGSEMPADARAMLMERLRAKEVTIIYSAGLKEILDGSVIYEKEERDLEMRGVDAVVLAKGVISTQMLSDQLGTTIESICVIGDARNPGTALEAIAEGANVARAI